MTTVEQKAHLFETVTQTHGILDDDKFRWDVLWITETEVKLCGWFDRTKLWHWRMYSGTSNLRRARRAKDHSVQRPPYTVSRSGRVGDGDVTGGEVWGGGGWASA